MHTGDVHMDPDAQMAPAMRGYSGSMYLPWMVLQHYYFLLLELGYWVVPNIGHFFEVLAWSHKFEYPLSRLAMPCWRTQSTLLHLLYYVRHIILPSLVAIRASSPEQVFGAVGRELAVSLWMSTVGGFYLAFFFFLSFGPPGTTTINYKTFSEAAQSLIASRTLKDYQIRQMFERVAQGKKQFGEKEFNEEFENIKFTGKQLINSVRRVGVGVAGEEKAKIQ